MRNYIQPGQSIDLNAAAPFAVGQGYVVGSIFGVAANNAAVDQTVTLHLTGIYAFPGAGSIGDVAHWDDAAKEVFGDSAAGLFAIGSIVGIDGANVQVRLDGKAVSAVAAPAAAA